jgi:hypothetical protein
MGTSLPFLSDGGASTTPPSVRLVIPKAGKCGFCTIVRPLTTV